MRWRLGGDVGTNSIGWCVVELDQDGAAFGIIALGSRIYGDGRDPKSKQSLAVDRRLARAMRRSRDRFKQRQAALLKQLTAAALFPPETDAEARAALERLDPFELRARALHAPLAPHELGRALFHLNQRRGFKSNRKTDRKSGDDSGKIRQGVQRLQQQMAAEGAHTFGEFLHNRRAAAPDQNHVPSVRTRLRPEAGPDAKGDGYDFYPDRRLIEEEFERIWESQLEHHPTRLTQATHDAVYQAIFDQRPLKPPRIGMCTLVPGEQRLPKSHPLFQRRRLLEEVNALRIIRAGQTAQPLTLEQRDLLLLKLRDTKQVKFETLRTKLLKLDRDARFNKEHETRTELRGDEVASVMTDKKRFGPRWGALSADRQWEVVDRIRQAETEAHVDALREWLQDGHSLSPEQAKSVADAHLPEGFGRFGLTATRKLIEALQAEVVVYSVAVERAGLGHHSDFRNGEVRDTLPYYGQILERHVLPGTGDPHDEPQDRYGRLTNPTVHIGLNQLRRILNRLIKTYGPPQEIALELARELKQSEDEKKEINRRNARNQADAKKRSTKLGELNIPDKGSNRAIVKLWEELNRDNALDRRCIYTGVQISAAMLFSGGVEVDHILPFAATLDDSGANRILCLREANRAKRKRSPFEAFGHTLQWEEIAARAARLPREKRWRFEPDAMARFDADGGFLARQLVDTQHLSRRAREYVSALYPGKGEGSSHVWVSPGRLTEMLRRSWGLNSLLPDHNVGGGGDQPKNRRDHRHHAIDAAVIAVTDRGLLNRIAREAGQHGQEDARRMAHEIAPPWESFREELEAKLRTVVASHRADHGTASKAGRAKGRDTTAGRLHNDTAYGLTGRMERGVDLVVHRIPLDALKPDHLVDTGARVADKTLRDALASATSGLEGKAFTEALLRLTRTHPTFRGVRRVRVLEPLSVIPIRDAQGRAYKAYKGDSNHRYDLWELAGGRWVGEVVSTFDAHQPGWESRIRRDHHNPRKLLSLHRDDLIAIDRGQGRELMRVVKFTEGQFALAPPNEGGPLKARDADKSDPFRYLYASPTALRAWSARQVRIDELGRVQDPGPRAPPASAAP